MKKYITIEDARRSLVMQISQIIKSGNVFYFDESVPCTLKSGQQIPCTAVEGICGISLKITLSIENIQEIEVSNHDVTLESLDNILSALNKKTPYLTIYALDDGDPLIIYSKATERFDNSDDMIDCLNNIISMNWVKDDDRMFIAYPDPENKDRFFHAVFS